MEHRKSGKLKPVLSYLVSESQEPVEGKTNWSVV